MQSLKYVLGATLILALPYYLISSFVEMPSPETQESLSAKAEDAALSIEFSPAETEVPLAAKKPLEKLAEKMIAHPNLTVRIIGYASGGDEKTDTSARRISLSRALSIRTFLINRGADNLHIMVEAMGNQPTSGNPERADVILK